MQGADLGNLPRKVLGAVPDTQAALSVSCRPHHHVSPARRARMGLRWAPPAAPGIKDETIYCKEQIALVPEIT